MGIARVLEALQANDWTAPISLDDDEDDEFGDFAQGDPKPVSTSGRKKLYDDSEEDDDDVDLDPEDMGFGFDREDFVGLKKAIWGAGMEDFTAEDSVMDGKKDDAGTSSRAGTDIKPAASQGDVNWGDNLQEEDVEKIESMMKKLLAVRDMSAGLPEEQRKKMAKKAVDEVMKDL
jgi:hypothetical protein